jgi:hypothetical protein
MARDDLPAVLVSLPVTRSEDFSADRAGSALEQSPEALGGADQRFVCGVGAPLHVLVGRSCLLWVHGITALIRTLEHLGRLSTNKTYEGYMRQGLAAAKISLLDTGSTSRHEIT